jgi:hypothetical protein
MLAVYLGEAKLQVLSSTLNRGSQTYGQDVTRQLMLLSPHVSDHFANGRFSLKRSPLSSAKTRVRPYSESIDVL